VKKIKHPSKTFWKAVDGMIISKLILYKYVVKAGGTG
jgi:hypothetical protein